MEEDYIDQSMIGKIGKKIKMNPISFRYDIDISGVIGHPSEYIDEFNVLRFASPNDIVCLHINSEGGQLNTLVQWVNAIRGCQATVTTFLESEAHSAAGALFLQGDQFVVGDHVGMLIHEPSGGNWDYHSKSKKFQEFSNKHSEDVFADYYKGFLTTQEIEDILEGKDLWLSSKDIADRLRTKCELEEEELEEKSQEN